MPTCRGQPWATRVQTVRIFSRCLKNRGQNCRTCPKETRAKSLTSSRRTSETIRPRCTWAELATVLTSSRRESKKSCHGQKSGPVDLSGQTRAGLQKRPDRLSAAPTYTLGTFNAARGLQCRTPRTCRARATVPECRRMSQRQCGRAEPPACAVRCTAAARSAFPS